MKKSFIIAGLAVGMMFSAPLASEASAASLGLNIHTNARVETVDYRGRHYDRDYRRDRRHERREYYRDRRHDRYERWEHERYRRSFSHWRPRYAHRFHRWGRPVYYEHHRGWGPAYRVRAYDRARDRAVILWISAVTGAILLSQY